MIAVASCTVTLVTRHVVTLAVFYVVTLVEFYNKFLNDPISLISVVDDVFLSRAATVCGSLLKMIGIERFLYSV